MDTNTLARSDAFFIITSVAVVLITLVAVVGLVYFVGILKSIRRTIKTVEQVTDSVSKDITDLRDHVKNRGFGAALLGDVIKSWRSKRPRSKTKK